MAHAPKPLRVAAPTNLTPIKEVDWTKCCICQSKTSKPLILPDKNPASSKPSGYNTLAKALEELRRFEYLLPSKFPVTKLDDGEGIEKTLMNHNASWHKACYNMFTIAEKFNRIKAKLEASEPSSSSDKRVTRSTVPLVSIKDQKCFICSGPSTWKDPLHQAEYDTMIKNVEECAKILQDSKLLAILSSGDVVAQDAKYHLRCLTQLHNRCKLVSSKRDGDGTRMCEGLAFADLINFMQEKLEDDTSEYVFKVPNLIEMYRQRLSVLLAKSPEEIPFPQTTRFRSRILGHLPELTEVQSGRVFFLKKKTANIHKEVVREDEDYDADALAVNRFLKNLRSEISKSTTKFDGNFTESCQKESIPPALLSVVMKLLYGSGGVRDSAIIPQPALTISQLITFNHQQRIPKTDKVRHNRDREPPLPLYLGLSVYGQYRSKKLIDELHSLGICVSSNRVMEVTSDLCHLVVERFSGGNIASPFNLDRKGFLVAALDNVDHNPSSTTAEGSFHGTSISVFQLHTDENLGQARAPTFSYDQVANVKGRRHVPSLPDSYAVVTEYDLAQKQPHVPGCSEGVGQRLLSEGKTATVWKNESSWLNHIQGEMYEIESDTVKKGVSWGAYHAKNTPTNSPLLSTNVLLPLFYEHSASISMIRHGMELIRRLTGQVNFGQTPVLCMDQPLYAKGKLIQWNWPHIFGEEKIVLFFAPFHVEQNFLKVLGQLMEGCGWVSIAASSGIITEGSAEAVLKVTHVTRARLFHQITAATLYGLMLDAYKNDAPNGETTIDSWMSQLSESSPTAMFWFTVLNTEILLLTFVRAIRTGDFELFKACLRDMMPWFFAFDHVNYCRWVPVFLKDLQELEVKAPDVYDEFSRGNFVVRKTKRAFSSLAIDQAHEQNNAKIKGLGGAIGLTQDPGSLRRWMLAGPEVCRLLSEFQRHEREDDRKHHEEYASFQTKFLENSVALKGSFLQHGNPFLERSPKLIVLDSRVILPAESVNALYRAEKAGGAYAKFVEQRFVNKSKPFFDPISKCGTKIFALRSKKKAQKSVQSLKLDVQLFSRLFIVARERDLDLESFFKYENQKCPPSLSLDERLRPGNKSDLSHKLESLSDSSDVPSSFDGIIFDGAALTQYVRPQRSRTFAEYCSLELKPHLSSQARSKKAARIDIVWDLYAQNSLKTTERESRGEGVRRQVLAGVKLPSDWSDFLRNSDNKTDLFLFLGRCLLSGLEDTTVVTNIGEEILSSKAEETSLNGEKCGTKEEADGRIFLHAKDMVEHGAKKILIRCSDTDVLVLCIAFFRTLQEMGLEELWMSSGTGNNRRYISTHRIAAACGQELAPALPGFHSFTGCDTTSFFCSKGKKTAWKVWTTNKEFSQAFRAISGPLDEVPEDVMASLERFTVLLYDAKSTCVTVDEARKDLFASKNKLVQFLPPTSAALRQHILRATYQAGHVWATSMELNSSPPSPEKWGWMLENNKWAPVWTKKPQVWEQLSMLEKCGCRTACNSMRCACRRVGLPCTLQCTVCKGGCENSSSSPDFCDDDDESIFLCPDEDE